MKNFFTTTLPKYGNLLIFGGSGAFFYQSIRDNNLRKRLENSQNENKLLHDEINNLKEGQKQEMETTLNNTGESTEIGNSIDTIERVSKELEKIVGENNDLSEIAKEHVNTIINENKKINSILEKCIELIKGSKNGNNFIDNLDLTNRFDNLQNILSELDHAQVGAIMHISACIVIFYCLITIFSTLLGDRFINYFKLVDRFPRLAKFIKLRQQILNINLILNIIIILFVLLIVIYLNFLVLFS